MTSDGTEVSVRATVANTAAPGEGVWNQTPVAHRSSNFPLVGGRVGFRTVYGIAKVHQFTLETDPDDNGTWTTEYAGTFDHPSGHATVTYDHDDAGNLTFDGVYRYGYDAWNRLVEVRNAYREQTGSQNVQQGSVVTAMAYDGLGRRIVKTVSNSGDLDATLHSLYDAQREIEERNGADFVLRQQVWGLDYIDELVVVSTNLNPQSGSSSQDPDPQQCDVDHYAVLDAQFNVLGLIGVELSQASGIVTSGAWTYSGLPTPYQAVRQSTAQNGYNLWPIVVVERYEYTPYGQRQVYRGSDNDRKAYAPHLASARLGSLGHSLNPFGHQGLKHDEGIGLVYNRARMLHPGLGRFMQRDPLGYVDGMSVYAYYAGMWGYVDPSGLHGSNGRGRGSGHSHPREQGDSSNDSSFTPGRRTTVYIETSPVTRLGVTLGHHSSVVAACGDNPTMRFEDVGPENHEDPHNERKKQSVLPADYTRPDYDTSWERYNVSCNEEACSCDTYKCLQESFDEAQFVEYRTFGPNSNTFARALLERCGCRVDRDVREQIPLFPVTGVPLVRSAPDDVPGWESVQPDYWTAVEKIGPISSDEMIDQGS